jgi:hypothetical protein
MRDLNFHVRHEITPDRTWAVLVAIVQGYDFDHVTQYDRQLSRLRQLGLIDKAGKGFQLMQTGQCLYQIGVGKPDTALDLLHYLHYTLWSTEHPLENGMSWTYRTYCGLLFQRGECTLNPATREALATEMNNIIAQSSVFEPFIAGETKKGAVSLSTNSLSGIHHWLTKLSPPAIEDEKFALRSFCQPELLLMAIGFVIRESESDLSIDQLLTDERREQICQLCLLDPHSFDRSLDWMLPLFPHVLKPGTRTGSYGRFIRLLKSPQLQDLLQ